MAKDNQGNTPEKLLEELRQIKENQKNLEKIAGETKKDQAARTREQENQVDKIKNEILDEQKKFKADLKSTKDEILKKQDEQKKEAKLGKGFWKTLAGNLGGAALGKVDGALGSVGSKFLSPAMDAGRNVKKEKAAKKEAEQVVANEKADKAKRVNALARKQKRDEKKKEISNKTTSKTSEENQSKLEEKLANIEDKLDGLSLGGSADPQQIRKEEERKEAAEKRKEAETEFLKTDRQKFQEQEKIASDAFEQAKSELKNEESKKDQEKKDAKNPKGFFGTILSSGLGALGKKVDSQFGGVGGFLKKSYQTGKENKKEFNLNKEARGIAGSELSAKAKLKKQLPLANSGPNTEPGPGGSNISVALGNLDSDLEFMKSEQLDGENERVEINSKLDFVRQDIFELKLIMKGESPEPITPTAEEEEEEKKKSSLFDMIIAMFGFIMLLKRNFGKFVKIALKAVWKKFLAPIIMTPINLIKDGIGVVKSLVEGLIKGISTILTKVTGIVFRIGQEVGKVIGKVFTSILNRALSFLPNFTPTKPPGPRGSPKPPKPPKPQGFFSKLYSKGKNLAGKAFGAVKTAGKFIAKKTVQGAKFVKNVAVKVGSAAWKVMQATKDFAKMGPTKAMAKWMPKGKIMKALGWVFKKTLLPLLKKAPFISVLFEAASLGYTKYSQRGNKKSPRENMIALMPGAGSLVGTVVGGVLGSFLGPVGAFFGSIGGSMLGDWLATKYAPELTDMIGSVFSDDYTVAGSKRFMAQGKKKELVDKGIIKTVSRPVAPTGGATPVVTPPIVDVKSVDTVKTSVVSINEASPTTAAERQIRTPITEPVAPQSSVVVNQVAPQTTQTVEPRSYSFQSEDDSFSHDMLRFLRLT